MGMTPLDTADKAYLNNRVEFPPSVSHHVPFTSIVARPSDEFLPENRGKLVERNAVRTWRLVHQAAEMQPCGAKTAGPPFRRKRGGRKAGGEADE